MNTFGPGYNCMQHGTQQEFPCPRCAARDQQIREAGFKEGYDAGYRAGQAAPPCPKCGEPTDDDHGFVDCAHLHTEPTKQKEKL